MTTYAGQNVGAGLYDRVEKGNIQGSAIAAGVSLAVTEISDGKGRVPVYFAIGSMAVWDGVCRRAL